MKKFNFQDLPNTDTPIKASTLNTMQSNIEESCVAVSPTQPETNEKVWIQKGKNLFNRENSILKGYYLSNEGTYETSIGSYVQNYYIAVSPNTEYILWHDKGDALRVGFFDNNEIFISRQTTNEKNLHFTTPANCKYLIISWDVLETSNDDNNIQLEQGSTATEYEAYIEETVWVKNDNGVYIPFKPENKPINIETGVEFETGRIIDGKKEYGKRIDCGALPNTGTITIPHGLDFYNICLTHIEGIAQRDTFVIILPYVSYEASWQIELIVSNTNIMITTKDDKSVYTSSNVTIYYTKN